MDDQPVSSEMSLITEVPSLERLALYAMDWVAPELIEKLPKLIFLRGTMGSGKTSFVSKVASVLGATDAASPSFALHSRYSGPRGTIDHFDLDRLQSMEDLESIGFWDLIEEARRETRRFVMIEWAGRLDEFGAGSEQAPWTHGFRTWTFSFEGYPRWRVIRRRLA